MAFDIHILPVQTVESFPNGFPQAVENSCGYVDKHRFRTGLQAVFPCFLPKEAAEPLSFPVKFARNSGFPHFQTSFHRLLKTSRNNPQFRYFSASRKKRAAEKTEPAAVSHSRPGTEIFIGKRFGKYEIFPEPRNTSGFSHLCRFLGKNTPVFRRLPQNHLRISKTNPHGRQKTKPADFSARIQKRPIFSGFTEENTQKTGISARSGRFSTKPTVPTTAATENLFIYYIFTFSF